MNPRFKFRHVNELTGALVLLALALAILAIVFAGRAQHWFAPTSTFKLVLPEQGAFGLDAGNEVLMLGLSAGWVDRVEVDVEGRVTARLKIRRDFARLIRTDSLVTLSRSLVVAGATQVDISAGTGPPLPGDRPVLKAAAPAPLVEQLEMMLAEVREQAAPVLESTRATLDKSRQLLERADQLVAALQDGQGTMGRLLTDPALALQSRELLEQGQQSFANLQGLIDNLREGTRQLPELSQTMTAGTQHLPGVLLQAEHTLRELEVLVAGLQRHWLVRRYMDGADPPPQRISPADVQGGLP
jgi:phospholipid/cholesterol/gamma-HCH transport system substrate-binding protein